MPMIYASPEGWMIESVSTEKSKRKVLGGPFKTRSEAEKRVDQINYFSKLRSQRRK